MYVSYIYSTIDDESYNRFKTIPGIFGVIRLMDSACYLMIDMILMTY